MTADVACRAAWLLQVKAEGAVSSVVGAQGRSHGRQGGTEEVLDSHGWGRT
jgi:hypothetical protein